LSSPESTYLTAAEVAKVLRVGPWAVLQLCQSGDLKATKPTKSWLIARADLDAYLAAHSNQPAVEAKDAS
jgi:excisionase family DNA binding protein